jgi:hypothetical protein
MRRSLAIAALLAACLLPVLAGPVAAFPLSTCTLSIESTDASGASLDTAQSGAQDSTASDPFKVEWEGSVGYTGSTTVVIKDYTYQVSVFGVPTPIRGSDANDDENTDGDGSVSVSSTSPFRVAGLYFVSGSYKGAGGECAGSGWFQLLGSPVGTVPWIAGVVITVLGALGLVGGARGNTIVSVVGGVALGLGVAILFISHSFMPLAENTPLAALVVAVIAGVVIGILGRRGGGGSEPEPV